ncbi:MAG: hypothetical protein ACI84K_002039 [Pseudohongiellaceae bacterium]|jgi:hypothetical protein
MLALEDTSTVCYRHNVSKELGHTGVYNQSPSKGMLAHTVLMVDAETKHTFGLAAQHRWCRKNENFGTANDRKRRKYETRESYKWQRSSEEMNTRFANVMDNIISVCDRGSDMFEYIDYKTTQNQRFVVRAKHERLVNAQGDRLTPYVENQSTELSYSVKIQQKGGRKARIAKVAVRYACVTIYPPKKHKKLDGINLSVISCNEISPPNDTSSLS